MGRSGRTELEQIAWMKQAYQRRQKIRAMVARGVPQAEVARRFNISRERVRQIINS